MRILTALIQKEFHQIVRDPSSIMIAFVLPTIVLFIYMFAINLDTLKIRVGLKIDDEEQQISSLIDSFSHSKFVTAVRYNDRKRMYDDLVSTKLRGIIVIPNDFSEKLKNNETATVQVISDGSEVNLSNYVQSYPKVIINQWLSSEGKFYFKGKNTSLNPQIRCWYNQKLDSHHFILPGSLAITMTLIGLLLTALVIAREWERGTMEALITTRANKFHIIFGKYISYFILGMFSMLFNFFLCVIIFKIPFRGNFYVLMGFSSLFLFTALGQGLLLSTILKSQFAASQASIFGGFLPSLMLSGLIYPINSMPIYVQYITLLIPARYYVDSIQTEFLAGTVWGIVLPNSFYLAIFGALLFLAVYLATKMRLD